MTALRTLLAGLLLIATTACSTPGLYDTIPRQQLASSRKIVIVPIVGDKIGYRRQGVFKGDSNDLSIAGWRANQILGEQLQAAIKNSLQVDTALYVSEPSEGLELLHNGRAAPGNTGLEFSKIKPALRKIFDTTGADAAVLLFKGVSGIYGVGGRPYWVQGTVVSNGTGVCEITPNMMIGIVDKRTLETVAANYVVTNAAFAERTVTRTLPDEICDLQLEELSFEQAETLRKAFFSHFNERVFNQSISRLLTSAKRD